MAGFLCFALAFSCLSNTAFALTEGQEETASVDSSETVSLQHTLDVKDANGNAPEFVGTQWNLTGGEYTVSGTAQSYEGLKVSGDVTLKLDGATIIHTTADKNQYTPAISIESGTVNMVLSGENSAVGSFGYAGVYVAESAALTISGTGSLTATGGNYYKDLSLYYAAGAGIGGNGLVVQGNNVVEYHTPNFGEITIAGGTVVATGGANTQVNYGAGAGIGAGGGSSMWNLDPVFKGTIHISGGNVTATGGQGDSSSLTGGGAGIGTGGVTGNVWEPYPDQSSIVISGGTVTAHGTSDGAGIGGGANVNSNSILIEGGTVLAVGGSEGDGTVYGGAGIGGGDNGHAGTIVISGTADVTAQGGGVAAGIGGGNYGNCGLIEIKGSANVKATGGEETSRSTGNRGGAGIGSGRYGSVGQINILENANVTATGKNGGAGIGSGFDGAVITGITIEGATVEAHGSRYTYVTDQDGNSADGFGGAGIGAGISWQYDNGCGTISIANGATVRAYTDGRGTNAIGVGGLYAGGDANSLHLDNTISLWAQTPDMTKSALLDVTEDGSASISYSSQDVYLTASNSDSEANGWLELPGEVSKTFAYAVSDVLTIDGNVVDGAAPAGTVGSWAALYRIPAITVSYQYVGSAPEGVAVPASDTIDPGAQYTSKAPAEVDGWQFDGWYTDEACTEKFIDGTELMKDTTLYGKWSLKSTPVIPTTAVYKVEHYQQQDDGSYVLAETEFPLYGKIGETVNAVPRSYDGYSVNREKSTMHGAVITPVEENGETTYLVLTVYYDKDKVSTPTDPEQPSEPSESTTPTQPSNTDAPQTGDTRNPVLWISLLVISAAGAGITLVILKKRSYRGKWAK